jgi:hypothetical protein
VLAAHGVTKEELARWKASGAITHSGTESGS